MIILLIPHKDTKKFIKFNTKLTFNIILCDTIAKVIYTQYGILINREVY